MTSHERISPLFGAVLTVTVFFSVVAFIGWRNEVVSRIPSLEVQSVTPTGRSEIADTFGSGRLPTTAVKTNAGTFIVQGVWVAGSRADLGTRRNGRLALCIEGGSYCYPFAHDPLNPRSATEIRGRL